MQALGPAVIVDGLGRRGNHTVDWDGIEGRDMVSEDGGPPVRRRMTDSLDEVLAE